MLAPQQTIVWINANFRCEGAAADLLYFRLPTYVCQRMREQTRTHLGAEANASGSRDERVWEQTRLHTGWRSPKGIGAEAEAMFFRLSALFPVSGHQRQLAACTEKRRCKTRMGCATPLFIKEHLFNAL
ncbi:MAG: hypothetical protein EGR33_02400 [Prevotella sp.]|nr:hypothetical protein [Prevotella sp.]